MRLEVRGDHWSITSHLAMDTAEPRLSSHICGRALLPTQSQGNPSPMSLSPLGTCMVEACCDEDVLAHSQAGYWMEEPRRGRQARAFAPEQADPQPLTQLRLSPPAIWNPEGKQRRDPSFYPRAGKPAERKPDPWIMCILPLGSACSLPNGNGHLGCPGSPCSFPASP